jgi:hypothetical protein
MRETNRHVEVSAKLTLVAPSAIVRAVPTSKAVVVSLLRKVPAVVVPPVVSEAISYSPQ